MKTDLYTKTVLTVIAGALLYLCFAKNAAPVQAYSVEKASEGQPQKVIIVGVADSTSPLPVIPHYINDQGGLFRAGSRTPLPVRVVP